MQNPNIDPQQDSAEAWLHRKKYGMFHPTNSGRGGNKTEWIPCRPEFTYVAQRHRCWKKQGEEHLIFHKAYCSRPLLLLLYLMTSDLHVMKHASIFADNWTEYRAQFCLHFKLFYSPVLLKEYYKK